MKTIYKYSLNPPADLVILDVPHGAEFIHAQEQHDVACLWAIVDSEQPMTKRAIRMVGTGNPAGDVHAENYIGSVLVLKGTYVWHIFDMGEFLQ